MKKIFLILLFAFSLQQSMQSMDASISYATFHSPNQNYIELYLYVLGTSVGFQTIDTSRFQANVEVIIIFKQDEEIIKFDKYQLNSPVFNEKRDFLDIKRYGLDNGEYDLEISLSDLNQENNAKTYTQKVKIEYNETGLNQSDIQLLSSFEKVEEPNPLCKNGYYMEPLSFNFMHKNLSKIIFYSEVYNSDKTIGDRFAIRYAVDEYIGNGKTKTVLLGHKKMDPKPVNVVFVQRDISSLPSGNYRLLVEVRSRTNELLSSKSVDFQRSNPYLEIDLNQISAQNIQEEFVNELTDQDLRYSLKAIAPVIKDADVEVLNMVIGQKDPEAQRRFLFSYWASQNPNAPKLAYDQYMQVANAVDKKFKSGFGYGFETDRGWTFMKYGKPDDVVSVEEDPTAPPYEIWIYYEFPQTEQNNVKFLFYNKTLAHNDYELLHSTAIGEFFNPQWQLDLYHRSPGQIDGNNFIDGRTVQDNFNRHADRFFSDF